MKKHTLSRSVRAIAGKRATAFFLTVCLALGSSSALPAAPLDFAPAESSLQKAAFSDLKVPNNLGRVHEVHRGKRDSWVFLLQDAHALPAAQKNEAALLQWLVEKAGVRRIWTEGAAAPLSLELLRSFPQPAEAQKILASMIEQGELSGVMLAALTAPGQVSFEGLEEAASYRAAVLDYLQASLESGELLQGLSPVEAALESLKGRIWSPEMRDLDRAMADFSGAGADLHLLLEYLQRQSPPSGKPHLTALLQAQKALSPEENSRLRTLYEKTVLRLESEIADPAKLRVLHERRQRYLTSELDLRSFGAGLAELAQQQGWPEAETSALAESSGGVILPELEPPDFFEELQAHVAALKSGLLTTEEARLLDHAVQQARALRRLVTLQLTSAEWKALQPLNDEAVPQAHQDSGLGAWMAKLNEYARSLAARRAACVDFYRQAETRDRIFADKILKNLAEERAPAAVLAGGFHMQGITAILKQQNISYVLVAPEVPELPSEDLYQKAMKGEVSWARDIPENRNRVDFYGLFLKAAVSRLLANASNSGGDQTALAWRDQALRDLASAGRLSEAPQVLKPLYDAAGQGIAPEGRTQPSYGSLSRSLDALQTWLRSRDLTPESLSRLFHTPALMPYLHVPVPGNQDAEIVRLARRWRELSAVPASRTELRMPEESSEPVLGRDPVEGLRLISFANTYTTSGGLSSHLENLNRELVRRHDITIYQVYPSIGREKVQQPRTEVYEKGRIVYVPLHPREPSAGEITASVSLASGRVVRLLRLAKRVVLFLTRGEGAAANAIRNWINAFRDMLYEPFLTPLTQKLPVVGGRIREAVRLREQFSLELQSILEETGDNPVLFINHSPDAPASIGIAEIVRRRGVPGSLEYHGGYITHRYLFSRMRQLLSHTSGVQVQGLESLLGRRAITLGNGINVQFFDPDNESIGDARHGFRAQYGIPLDKKMILVPARVTPDKRQNDALEVLRQLRDSYRHEDVMMVFAGDQRPENADFQAMLDQLIRDYHLESNVVFTGNLSPEDLRRAYAAADMGLLMSSHEGRPRVVLEMGAMRLPVVATDADGTRETFMPGASGFLVPIGNTREAAARLDDFLSNERMRRDFGGMGRSFVQHVYSLEALAERHAEFYRGILAAYPRRSELRSLEPRVRYSGPERRQGNVDPFRRIQRAAELLDHMDNFRRDWIEARTLLDEQTVDGLMDQARKTAQRMAFDLRGIQETERDLQPYYDNTFRGVEEIARWISRHEEVSPQDAAALQQSFILFGYMGTMSVINKLDPTYRAGDAMWQSVHAAIENVLRTRRGDGEISVHWGKKPVVIGIPAGEAQDFIKRVSVEARRIFFQNLDSMVRTAAEDRRDAVVRSAAAVKEHIHFSMNAYREGPGMPAAVRRLSDLEAMLGVSSREVKDLPRGMEFLATLAPRLWQAVDAYEARGLAGENEKALSIRDLMISRELGRAAAREDAPQELKDRVRLRRNRAFALAIALNDLLHDASEQSREQTGQDGRKDFVGAEQPLNPEYLGKGSLPPEFYYYTQKIRAPDVPTPDIKVTLIRKFQRETTALFEAMQAALEDLQGRIAGKESEDSILRAAARLLALSPKLEDMMVKARIYTAQDGREHRASNEAIMPYNVLKALPGQYRDEEERPLKYVQSTKGDEIFGVAFYHGLALLYMGDVDNFKQVNDHLRDHFGLYPADDRILMNITSDIFRGTLETLARSGGHLSSERDEADFLGAVTYYQDGQRHAVELPGAPVYSLEQLPQIDLLNPINVAYLHRFLQHRIWFNVEIPIEVRRLKKLIEDVDSGKVDESVFYATFGRSAHTLRKLVERESPGHVVRLNLWHIQVPETVKTSTGRVPTGRWERVNLTLGMEARSLDAFGDGQNLRQAAAVLSHFEELSERVDDAKNVLFNKSQGYDIAARRQELMQDAAREARIKKVYREYLEPDFRRLFPASWVEIAGPASEILYQAGRFAEYEGDRPSDAFRERNLLRVRSALFVNLEKLLLRLRLAEDMPALYRYLLESQFLTRDLRGRHALLRAAGRDGHAVPAPAAIPVPARPELRSGISELDIAGFWEEMAANLGLDSRQRGVIDEILLDQHPFAFSFRSPMVLLNLIETLFSPRTDKRLVDAILHFKYVYGLDDSLNVDRLEDHVGHIMEYYFLKQMEDWDPAEGELRGGPFHVEALAMKTRQETGGANPDALIRNVRTGVHYLGEFKSFTGKDKPTVKHVKDLVGHQIDKYARAILTATTPALYPPFMFHEPPRGIFLGVGDRLITRDGAVDEARRREVVEQFQEWYRKRVDEVRKRLLREGHTLVGDFAGEGSYPEFQVQFFQQPELIRDDPEQPNEEYGMNAIQWARVQAKIEEYRRGGRYQRIGFQRADLYAYFKNVDPAFYEDIERDKEHGEIRLYHRYQALGATLEEREDAVAAGLGRPAPSQLAASGPLRNPRRLEKEIAALAGNLPLTELAVDANLTQAIPQTRAFAKITGLGKLREADAYEDLRKLAFRMASYWDTSAPAGQALPQTAANAFAHALHEAVVRGNRRDLLQPLYVTWKFEGETFQFSVYDRGMNLRSQQIYERHPHRLLALEERGIPYEASYVLTQPKESAPSLAIGNRIQVSFSLAPAPESNRLSYSLPDLQASGGEAGKLVFLNRVTDSEQKAMLFFEGVPGNFEYGGQTVSGREQRFIEMDLTAFRMKGVRLVVSDTGTRISREEYDHVSGVPDDYFAAIGRVIGGMVAVQHAQSLEGAVDPRLSRVIHLIGRAYRTVVDPDVVEVRRQGGVQPLKIRFIQDHEPATSEGRVRIVLPYRPYDERKNTGGPLFVVTIDTRSEAAPQLNIYLRRYDGRGDLIQDEAQYPEPGIPVAVQEVYEFEDQESGSGGGFRLSLFDLYRLMESWHAGLSKDEREGLAGRALARLGAVFAGLPPLTGDPGQFRTELRNDGDPVPEAGILARELMPSLMRGELRESESVRMTDFFASAPDAETRWQRYRDFSSAVRFEAARELRTWLGEGRLFAHVESSFSDLYPGESAVLRDAPIAVGLDEKLVAGAAHSRAVPLIRESLDQDGVLLMAAQMWSSTAPESLELVEKTLRTLDAGARNRYARVDNGQEWSLASLENEAGRRNIEPGNLIVFMDSGAPGFRPLTAEQKERGLVFLIAPEVFNDVPAEEVLRILKRLALVPARLRQYYREQLGLRADPATGLTHVGGEFLGRLLDLMAAESTVRSAA